MHENLAILFSCGPEWLIVDPLSGVIPAGQCQDMTVTFKATALEAGTYTGNINITSNDLDEPVVTVPVTFEVGSTDGHTGRRSRTPLTWPPTAGGSKSTCGCRAGSTATDVLWETFFFQGGLRNGDAGREVRVAPTTTKWGSTSSTSSSTARLSRHLPEEGELVEVMVAGEIDCVTYMVGYDTVRVIRPRMNHPNGGEAFADLPGITENIIVAWEKPETWNVDSYSLYFSADDGASWQEVAAGITNQSYIMPLPEVATTQGLFRVYAYMDGVAVGYDSSDEPFTILRDSAGVPGEFKPTVFALSQNWPNPFSTGTSLMLDVPKDVQVELGVYDVSGRLVKNLVDGTLPAGRYNLGWDGRDANGHEVASGVYFYNVQAGSFHETKRMVVVK